MATLTSHTLNGTDGSHAGAIKVKLIEVDGQTIFEAKTIFLIHNINTMLLPEQKLWIDQSSGINFSKDCLRFLIAKIRSNGFYKKQLLDRMIYISFPSSTLTDYAKSITNQYDDKIIESLPLSFYESYIMENNDSIIISVPGVILEEARDYCILYEAFKKLLVKSERTIQLQLLGNSNNDFGKKIVSKFQQLESDNFELIFFRKQLSQRNYDKFLRKTDFMILPIQKYRKFGIIKEEYGKSNISGGLNDIVRFGIPTLLIYSYKSERRFKPLISTFRDKDELAIKLNDWIENSRYLEIREAAQPILEKLNEENTRINLVKRIKKMLN